MVALLPVVPGTAGEFNNFGITGATANGDVAIIWGTREQQNVEAHEICRKLITGIRRSRVLDMTTADENGNATLSVHISQKFAGTTVKYQAVDMATCTASDVVTETF